MAPFDRPGSQGAEAREALYQLAQAIGQIQDPTELYPVLGGLTDGLATLAQSLHQIAEPHDRPLATHAWVAGDERAGRAASYRVSWELHRAAEMVHQVAHGLARAQEVEASIAYGVQNSPTLAAVPGRRSNEPWLSL